MSYLQTTNEDEKLAEANNLIDNPPPYCAIGEPDYRRSTPNLTPQYPITAGPTLYQSNPSIVYPAATFPLYQQTIPTTIYVNQNVGTNSIVGMKSPHCIPTLETVTKRHEIVFGGINTGNEFSISLQQGNSLSPQNTPLNISVNLNTRKFSMNTCVNGQWGRSLVQKRCFILQPNSKRFLIKIVCRRHMFKIMFNGKHIMNYYYRQPLAYINHLMVKGDCVTDVLNVRYTYHYYGCQIV